MLTPPSLTAKQEVSRIRFIVKGPVDKVRWSYKLQYVLLNQTFVYVLGGGREKKEAKTLK